MQKAQCVLGGARDWREMADLHAQLSNGATPGPFHAGQDGKAERRGKGSRPVGRVNVGRESLYVPRATTHLGAA